MQVVSAFSRLQSVPLSAPKRKLWHYQDTARLDPFAPIHNSLGVIYSPLGKVSQATARLYQAPHQHRYGADCAESCDPRWPAVSIPR